MIPYEELERALARWKSRRSGTVESHETVSEEMGETPSGLTFVPASAPHSEGDSTGEVVTGEVVLSDAEVDNT